jgi:hypothetical protein
MTLANHTLQRTRASRSWPCASIALLLLLLACGCGRKAKEDAASLDAVLTNSRINRIEFVDEEKEKTNVFTGKRAVAVLQLFSATNRVVRRTSAWKKNYSAGRVLFFADTNYLFGLHYVPEYDALSRGQYYFAPKGTNELRSFFE